MFKTLFPLSLVFTIFFTSCQKDTTDPNPVPPPESMYFPPTSGTEWQTTTAASLGWNEALIPDLYTYLQSKGTKGFIVLKNGKSVMRKVFRHFCCLTVTGIGHLQEKQQLPFWLVLRSKKV